MADTPKYPQITVQLTGEDGNVFFIIGKMTKALRHADVSIEDRKAFTDACFSADDYDHVLRICMEYVNVE